MTAARDAIRVLLFLAAASVATAAMAETKVEDALARDIRTKGSQRVIALTRPDPERPNGGQSLSAPASYLAGKLGVNGKYAKQIGNLPAVVVEVNSQGLEQLREDPNVAKVTRDVPTRATLMDSVPSIGATTLHEAGHNGAATAVAVLDTGIDATHPALKDSIAGQACFSTPTSGAYTVRSLCPNNLDVSLKADAAGGCPKDVEGCEHGTHVAGIIAGHDMSFNGKSFSGVAPAAKVVAVQVFTLFDGEEQCGGSKKCVLSFTSDQLRALDWVYKNRVALKIAAVNMSLGSGYFDHECDSTSALTEIIERLKAKDIPTVVAAGNDAYYDGISEPACISSAYAVAALKKTGDFDADYSNMSKQVSFAAPGTGIVSTVFNKGYGALSGTSMATPHVAAAFALLKEEFPGMPLRLLARKLDVIDKSVENPKTGQLVKVLALTEAAGMQKVAGGNEAAPVEDKPARPASEADGGSPAAVPLPATGSVIVKTPSASGDVAATLRSHVEAGGGVDTEIKQIGRDSYRVDISPKRGSGADDEKAADQTNKAIERLKSIEGVKVFDNRLSAPKPSE